MLAHEYYCYLLHVSPAECHALVCAQLKLAGYGVGHKVAPVPAGTCRQQQQGQAPAAATGSACQGPNLVCKLLSAEPLHMASHKQ
jgi:hypothetical protein